MNIKRLMDIGCYRGIRHRRNLPVRGQRTHTNARTRKGPRKGAMISAARSRRSRRCDEPTAERRRARRARRRSRRPPAKKAQEGEEARRCTASPTCTPPSTTRSSPSPTSRATWSRGRARARSASRARARARPSRPSRPPTHAAANATRARPALDRRPGQGPGQRPRVGDPRAAGRRDRDQVDPRRHSDSAQRLPPAEAASRLRKDKVARYTGSVCRLCRREGMKLFLKGDRCFTEKCAIEQRNYAPGQHGKGGRIKSKVQGYGLQLREKQKVKRIYGMLEGQFALTSTAPATRRASRARLLLSKLERRLDNVVYRLGFGSSRAQARQLVRHGHVLRERQEGRHPVLPGEGGRRDHASRRAPPRTCSWRPRSRRSRAAACRGGSSSTPPDLSGKVLALPARDDVNFPIQEQLIVELYSKYGNEAAPARPARPAAWRT